MPVYEYRCSRGHRYDRVEGFDAPAEQTCPHCGGSARRQFSAPAVIFKGSGFYSTDNRKASSSGGSGGNGGSSAPAPEPEHAGDGGSEVKSEAKAAED